ncbi:hypothetical protein ACI48D_16940 [Massilia sp. LXY-6]|uniref:hypothetical protein n=1 Tax=Massilia sp. LXY-6 TaxID=3379823 RepID=UPI003EE363B6
MIFQTPKVCRITKMSVVNKRLYSKSDFLCQCHSLFFALPLLIALLIFSGCSGNKNEILPAANESPSSSISIQDSILASPFVASQSSNTHFPAQQQRTEHNANAEKINVLQRSEQLRKMHELAHLSMMSEENLLKLQNQLRAISLSHRLDVLNNYPEIAGLPTQQQQLLLGKLAEIVPDETPTMRVVCTCKTGPKHELCIKEGCAATFALSSICESLCGVSNISSTSCMPSIQCTDE